MKPSPIPLKDMILETLDFKTNLIFIISDKSSYWTRTVFRMLFYVTSSCQLRKDTNVKGPKENKDNAVFRTTCYRIISAGAAPRTPGTWGRQGGLRGSPRTAVSQICRAAECPASRWSIPLSLPPLRSLRIPWKRAHLLWKQVMKRTETRGVINSPNMREGKELS